MSLQRVLVFEHIALPADALAYALNKNAQGAPYNWRAVYPTLARLDTMLMRRSATIFPDDCPNNGHDAYLLEQLKLPLDTGTALMHAVQAKIPNARTDLLEKNFSQWFSLSPVHWQAHRDHVNLISFKPEDVDIDETRQLLKSIAPWLTELGWHIHIATPHQWYVRTLQHFDYHAPSLSTVQSGQLEMFLPHGRDLARWQTLLTEIQMTWFEHPVNMARTANKKMPINSLWLYGGVNARALNLSQVDQFTAMSDQIIQPDQPAQHDIYAHLSWLDKQLQTVLLTIEAQGQTIFNILGHSWQQDLLLTKPSLSSRVKSRFKAQKKPLNWLEEPVFDFLN